MNEHELSTGLQALLQERTRLPDVRSVHQEILTAPIQQIPQHRGFLPSLTRRLQSMFSATKFVVAGVIVALFGTYLLNAVLTQRPSDESAPVVGASASASSSPTNESAIEADPIADSSPFVTTVIDIATMEPRQLLQTSDAVWALSGRSVARIDLDTREVEVLRLPARILNRHIVDGSLWGTRIEKERQRLVEIDLSTGEFVDEYPMPASEHHWRWSAVIAGDLWFWDTDDHLARFDLADREFTFELAARRFLPGKNSGPCCLATDGAIWITKPDDWGFGSLRRFDVGTLEFSDRVSIDVLKPGMTAEGGIWVWQPSSDGETIELLRIDQGSHEITDVIAVPSDFWPSSPRLALSDGGIWVARNDGMVSRIDVASGDTTHTIDVGGTGGTPLAIDGAIWVPVPDARRVILITPEAVAATE